ncbi:MAG: polyphosphate polymerase domain-containing protein [Deltaproteobacteria bacterium]|nr:polyphosphate polymerase domain-containing protein [Deltaproteobacteria bacterium]
MEQDFFRKELKYIISYKKALAIKAELAGKMKPDEFTDPKKGYFIRSLYFDTHNFSFFLDKIDGTSNRIKLRLRTYWNDPHIAKIVKVEIKSKHNNLYLKYSDIIDLNEYRYFVRNKNFIKLNNIRTEFLRLIKVKNLLPSLIVDYNRFGYQPIEPSQLRITFDYDLRFLSTNKINLFPQKNFNSWRYLLNKYFILEIKLKEHFPLWLLDIIKKYDLYSSAVSKYCDGISLSQNFTSRL